MGTGWARRFKYMPVPELQSVFFWRYGRLFFWRQACSPSKVENVRRSDLCLKAAARDNRIPGGGQASSMTVKLRHLLVFIATLFLGAVTMYVPIVPWLRVMVAGLLLLPIIYAADGLGLAPLLNVLPERRERNRQFGVLRSEVMQLLDLVRRLNWLTVDLDRGVRPSEHVKAEIAAAERRLDEILAEIRRSAGQPSSGDLVDEEGVPPPALTS